VALPRPDTRRPKTKKPLPRAAVALPRQPLPKKPVGKKPAVKGKRPVSKGTPKATINIPRSPNDPRLKNPGWRSKVADKKLPAKYLEVRKRNKKYNAPLVPGSDIKYGEAEKEAKSEAELEFGDVGKELQQQLVSNAQTERNIGNWFGDYQNKLQARKGEDAAQVGAAQAEIAQRTAASQQAAEADRARMETEGRRSAAERGAEYNPAVTNLGMEAQASRRALQDAFQNMLTSQGAARQSYLGGRQVVGSQAGISAGLKNIEARKKTEGDIAGLAGKKGHYVTKALGEKRESARKSELEKYAFGMKAAESAKDRKARERKEARDQRNKNREYNFKVGNELWDRAHPKGKGGKDDGPTRLQKLDAQEQWGAAINFIRRNKGSNEADQRILMGTQLKNMKPGIQEAAFEYSRNKGRMSRKTARMLRERGIPVPREQIM
jgi:hypothetical protein